MSNCEQMQIGSHAMKLSLHSEQIGAILRSLERVGPEKPIGYLPLYTITDFLGLDSDELVGRFAKRGLTTVRFDAEHCVIKSGAVYIYDRDALAALLMSVSDVLETFSWPTDPDGFVRAVADEWLTPGYPILRVVQKGFGEEIDELPSSSSENSG